MEYDQVFLFWIFHVFLHPFFCMIVLIIMNSFMLLFAWAMERDLLVDLEPQNQMHLQVRANNSYNFFGRQR